MIGYAFPSELLGVVILDFGITIGDRIALFKGHSEAVYCIQPLRNTVWTGSDDHIIRVWNSGSAKSPQKYRLVFLL